MRVISALFRHDDAVKDAFHLWISSIKSQQFSRYLFSFTYTLCSVPAQKEGGTYLRAHKFKCENAFQIFFLALCAPQANCPFCAIAFERMNPERQPAQQLREKHYFQILGLICPFKTWISDFRRFSQNSEAYLSHYQKHEHV